MSRFQTFLIYLIFSFLIAGVGFVFSQDLNEEALENLNYPIAELGNCKNQVDCERYCEKSENATPCLDFAEINNLMPQSEIDLARKVLSAGESGGPGGCRGQEECERYCDVPGNMAECIRFGLEHDLIPPEERPDAEKALAAIEAGATPPPCRGKAACEEYCTKPENLEICLPFGEAAGFISPEEAEMIRKTGGQGPGNCRGKEACESYCQDSSHMEECINFGLQYGLIPPDEAEDAQKALEAIKKGAKMPNCRGKAECDVYCSQPENTEECIDFALAAGFMTAEEAEMAKKMAKAGIFGGPGGCKGKEECEAFCENPDNMIECIDFAVKAGLMSEEEAEQAKKMAAMGITGGPGNCKGEEECKAYCEDPAHSEECLNFAVQAGFMTQEEADAARQMGLLQMQGGPGGCRGEEECRAYCDDPSHLEECTNFAVQQGLMPPPEQMMPQIGPGEMQLPGGPLPEGMIPEGMMPPTEGFTQPPTQEELQQIQEQMMQQQIQQQMEQMMQQTPPPTETAPPATSEVPPQSLLELFLAGLLLVFGFSGF